MKEDKYVTYEEWRISREDIIEKSKMVTIKLKTHQRVKRKIVEGNVYQRQSFEVQKIQMSR